MRTRYKFIQTYVDEVEEQVNFLAQDGWRVFSVQFSGEMVDVVLVIGDSK
jgi:hypothetical protein